LADPEGAALHSYYTEGVLKSEGGSITEGIGQGRITENLKGFTPDMAFRIPDAEALPIVFDLLEHEGLCLGRKFGHQHCGGDPHGPRDGAGAPGGDHLVRLWHALSIEAL
jgi:cysteine synthase